MTAPTQDELRAKDRDPEAELARAGEVLTHYHDNPAPRWGVDHKHDGVPVHPGCYGCQSCFDCLIDEESPCYVPVTDEELAALTPATIDDSDPF